MKSFGLPMVPLLMLGACGPPSAPPYHFPLTPTQGPGAPYTPPQILPCADGDRVGYWASDCATQWCLPGADVDFFYSENLGKLMVASSTNLPMYVATIEASDTHCGPDIIPYRVWRLDPNFVYLGMLRPMIDPVRFCSGSKCDQVIYQGWVSAHPDLTFYFPAELSLSDIGQIASTHAPTT